MTLGDRVLLLGALADPVRLAVVDALVLGDRSPSDLAEVLGVTGNLLAHHLNVLEQAGVVQRLPSQADRRRTYVHLRRHSLDGVTAAWRTDPPARVLFVCTQNSARSQLAGMLWQMVSDVPVASAGTRPARRVNPGAVAAARRNGLRVPRSHPRPLDEVMLPTDFVVTVCDSAHEDLRTVGRQHVHWSVPDPVPAGTDRAFDDAFDDVALRVRDLADLIHPEETL